MQLLDMLMEAVVVKVHQRSTREQYENRLRKMVILIG